MKSTTTALSVRQRHALDAVRLHYTVHGRAPSYKEVGLALNVGTSQAFDLVRGCVAAGRLSLSGRHHGRRSMIRLINPMGEMTTVELVGELAVRNAALILVPPTGNDPNYFGAVLTP